MFTSPPEWTWILLATGRFGQGFRREYYYAGMLGLPVSMIVYTVNTAQQNPGAANEGIYQCFGPLVGSFFGFFLFWETKS